MQRADDAAIIDSLYQQKLAMGRDLALAQRTITELRQRIAGLQFDLEKCRDTLRLVGKDT